MESYLTNRYQCTKIGDLKLRQQQINCGVPQGSSLGSLLFLLYVNDLPLVSQFLTTLFADDTLLPCLMQTYLDCKNRANTQLLCIDHGLIQNKLSLNYSKTTYLLFNKQPNVPTRSKFFVIYKSKRNFQKRFGKIFRSVV